MSEENPTEEQAQAQSQDQAQDQSQKKASAEQPSATQAEPQAGKNAIDINMVDMVSMAASILDRMFIRATKEQAKPVFKELKQGKTIALGSVTIQEKWQPKLELELDYSEFRGPGFNFDVFSLAIKAVLQHIRTKFAARAELDILNSENGSILLHLPGVIKIGEQYNVLLIAFEMGNNECITIKLMFVEPDQYQQLQPVEA